MSQLFRFSRCSLSRITPGFVTHKKDHDRTLSVCLSCQILRQKSGRWMGNGVSRKPQYALTSKQRETPWKTTSHRKKKKLHDPLPIHQQLINVLELHKKNLDQLAIKQENGAINHAFHTVESLNCEGATNQVEKRHRPSDNRKRDKRKATKRIDTKASDSVDNSSKYFLEMDSVVDILLRRRDKLESSISSAIQHEKPFEACLDSFKDQIKSCAVEHMGDVSETTTLLDHLVDTAHLSTENHELDITYKAGRHSLSHKEDTLSVTEEVSNVSGAAEKAQIQPQKPSTDKPNQSHKIFNKFRELNKTTEISSSKAKKTRTRPRRTKTKTEVPKLPHIGASDESLLSRQEHLDDSTSELLGGFLSGFEEDVDQIPLVKESSTLAASRTKKPTSAEKHDSSKLSRSHNLVEDLKSYIDVCIHAGLLNKAHSTLCFYHGYSKTRSGSGLTTANLELYNMLMRGWAKKHNLDKILQLFKMLREEDGLQPNLQSFAALLECLGRMKHFNANAARKCLQDVQACGLDVKNIFNKCIFQKDERHFVLKAIQTVKPDFVPNPSPSLDRYNCKLVNHLNQTELKGENPYADVISADVLKERAEQQLYWEKQLFLPVDSIEWLPPPTDKTIEMRDKLKNVHDEWKSTLLASFNRKVDSINKHNFVLNVYPYTKLFKPEEYVDLILQEIQLLAIQSHAYSPGISFLWRRLGMRVQKKYLIQDKLHNEHAEKVADVYNHFSDEYNGPLRYHRETWQDLVRKHSDGPTLDIPDKYWPWHALRSLGKFLYDIILYDTKLDRNILKTSEEKHMIPAFYTVFRKNHKNQSMTEEIKPHPMLVNLYKEARWKELTFEVQDLPMLVPPIPWTSVSYGGNLLASTQLLRVNEMTKQHMNALKSLPTNQMNPVLDSLNVLSACPWKINKPVLDIITGIFNNKGDKDLDIPPPVSECPPIPKITLDMTSAEKSRLYQERLRIKQLQSQMYSLWCNELYKLSIANMFRDEIFWFPHNMDFRGRVYPGPPHFNHLGSDVTRSILLFAKGKPLGEHGLDWLKTHLINLTGLKKRCSNSQRLAYANEVMPDIIESAENPMMSDWWKSSDEPWQTLACCMELRNAVESPNPEAYVSHFPIHQDGSCNGLQHYAALGRDQWGAESVNLSPCDIPQDVYSDVAEMVEKLRVADAKAGNLVAQVLEGFVKRKVVKQTVMTTVYGVTQYGAKYQILRQLRDLPEFPQEHAWAASMYLTEKTFQSLQQMFVATKEIQDWFTACAQLISSVKRQPVEWVTPLGMPVIQPYHKTVISHRSGMIARNSHDMFEKPNATKQKNGMPPNFIHSLDSTHMMLTALHCLNEGITFVSVHDCFWTHACDVDTMNKAVREQFVALHSEPVLENLSKHMLQSVGLQTSESKELPQDGFTFLKSVLGMVPDQGNFDLKNVLKSTYFFS